MSKLDVLDVAGFMWIVRIPTRIIFLVGLQYRTILRSLCAGVVSCSRCARSCLLWWGEGQSEEEQRACGPVTFGDISSYGYTGSGAQFSEDVAALAALMAGIFHFVNKSVLGTAVSAVLY